MKDIRAEMPEYAGIHSHVLQDVLARLDKPFKPSSAVCVKGRRRAPTVPWAHPLPRFTYKEFGNGAMLDNGFLVLSKIGRIAARWSRPLEEGDAQDRHGVAGSRRLVCLLLVR